MIHDTANFRISCATRCTLPSLIQKINAKDIITLIIGLFTMGYTIYSSNKDAETISQINENTSELKEGRRTDSINNAAFQKYLIDSFGIERVGNHPLISSTTVKYFSTFLSTKSDLNPNENQVGPQSVLPDSSNYNVKLINDTLLLLSPKEKIWHSFYAYFDEQDFVKDLKYIPFFSNLKGSFLMNPTEITIANKKYNVNKYVFDLGVVTPNSPIKINISSNKNQFIVFGDELNTNKRYFYKNGIVTWIPEK